MRQVQVVHTTAALDNEVLSIKHLLLLPSFSGDAPLATQPRPIFHGPLFSSTEDPEAAALLQMAGPTTAQATASGTLSALGCHLPAVMSCDDAICISSFLRLGLSCVPVSCIHANLLDGAPWLVSLESVSHSSQNKHHDQAVMTKSEAVAGTSLFVVNWFVCLYLKIAID